MPREEDAMRGKDAHMQATKREESSNIPVLPNSNKGYENANPHFRVLKVHIKSV